MAENTSGIGTDSFNKSINEDINNYGAPGDKWTQARNASPNSKTGDLGALGNEPATLHCISLPNPSYIITGTIHLVDDRWLVFSTLPQVLPLDPTVSTGSEIGIFDASLCQYTTLVNDICLNFSTAHPIIGVSRKTSVCTYKAYWDDQAYNPDRVIEVNIDDVTANYAFLPGTTTPNPQTTIPWVQVCKDNDGTGVIVNDPINNPLPPGYVSQGCVVCVPVPGPILDCDKIRLARYIQVPCINIRKGIGSGTLPNGSYQVFVSYSMKGQKIGDWFMSNVQSLFSHDNVSGSIDIDITNADVTFQDLTVVVVSTVNQQTSARQVGIYSTHQQLISLDAIQTTWISVPVEQLVIRTPVIERTDAMYAVNDYLIRLGPRSKFDFNYQPLANQIITKWVSVEYPENYYRNGGSKTGYMKDEIYSLFIRFVYDTGDKSSSYHIPGRPHINPAELNLNTGLDTLPDEVAGNYNYNWVVENTGTFLQSTNTVLPDGGVEVGEGFMAYWESTERYPDQSPELWNALTPGTYPGTQLTDYQLCGKQIRHHRMPDETVQQTLPNGDPGALFNYNKNNQKIRVLGVKFENIPAPVDNNNIAIPGIVGYEILRGSRNGNRTIVAKGIINNMGRHVVPGHQTARQGLYQNYPFNDVSLDPFLSQIETTWSGFSNLSGVASTHDNFIPIGGPGAGPNNFSDKEYSFHSPDTTFTKPFLSANHIRVYCENRGDVIGKFEKSEGHPKEKLITNTAFFIAAVAGIGIAGLAANGKRSVRYVPGGSPGFSQVGFKTYDFDSGLGGGGGTLTYGTGQIMDITSQTTHNDIEGSDQSDDAQHSAGAQPHPDDETPIDTLTGDLNTDTDTLENGGLLGIGWATTLMTNLANPTQMNTASKYKDLLDSYITNSSGKYFTTQPRQEITQEDGIFKSIPGVFKTVIGLPLFLHFFTEGTDSVLRLIKALARYQDFALRYHSHCFYDTYEPSVAGSRRRVINEEAYIGAQITDFGVNYRINNLYRNSYVALELGSTLPYNWNTGVPQERTRISAGQVKALYDPELPSNFPPSNFVLKDPTKHAFGPGLITSEYAQFQYNNNGTSDNGAWQQSACYYASIKNSIRNLYGQLIQISQQPASVCMETIDISQTTQTSGTMFGGDIYVGRYTEKNTFYFFYDWLYDQPDGTQLNYPANRMMAWPRFWANFDQFETNDFTSSLLDTVITLQLPSNSNTTLPNDYYNIDGLEKYPTFNFPGQALAPMGQLASQVRMSVRYAWFYLFNSGVRDFYVESEINIDLRDHGDLEDQRHYDHFEYTDTKQIFDTKIIKSHNYYKYDYSLSISKLFQNYISWGNMQNRNYNPILAETCFQYTPNRLIYSLPAIYESYADNWLTNLPNNYKDFKNKITSVYSINKSGAIIFFDAASPLMFQGLDQLQTDLGTKLTLGDGGLFSQPMQSVINTDASYEYGSCQNRLSIMNTPAGLFWMCQNQGKIFTLSGGINELSTNDLRWWLAQYLPFRLLDLYPDFEMPDNTISGVGCQSIYDNENGLAYFCKKDYTLLAPFNNIPGDPNEITYLSDFRFTVVSTGLVILLGDPAYFEDVSWTISYDPKTQAWIGYHDWHPNLMLPGKNTFMSISNVGQDPVTLLPLNNSIWIHNERTDLYCNYYGFNYPFEIEFMVNTGQEVNTLRSIQYILECYKYDVNQYDRFHILDANFDEATIYNTEQCSGLLKLILTPKNLPVSVLQYPIIQPVPPGSIQILFSKEENRYRLNQFQDFTDDRGEYNPIAQRMIWNTQGNGYVRVLNENNLNYNKPLFQRKKFRHYQTRILLRKLASQEIKLLMQLANIKNLKSSR